MRVLGPILVMISAIRTRGLLPALSPLALARSHLARSGPSSLSVSMSSDSTTSTDSSNAPDAYDKLKMEDVVGLCKRRGFIFPSSEIYNGFAGFYDYGPLGCEVRACVDTVVGDERSASAWEAGPAALESTRPFGREDVRKRSVG